MRVSLNLHCSPIQSTTWLFDRSAGDQWPPLADNQHLNVLFTAATTKTALPMALSWRHCVLTVPHQCQCASCVCSMSAPLLVVQLSFALLNLNISKKTDDKNVSAIWSSARRQTQQTELWTEHPPLIGLINFRSLRSVTFSFFSIFLSFLFFIFSIVIGHNSSSSDRALWSSSFHVLLWWWSLLPLCSSSLCTVQLSVWIREHWHWRPSVRPAKVNDHSTPVSWSWFVATNQSDQASAFNRHSHFC